MVLVWIDLDLSINVKFIFRSFSFKMLYGWMWKDFWFNLAMQCRYEISCVTDCRYAPLEGMKAWGRVRIGFLWWLFCHESTAARDQHSMSQTPPECTVFCTSGTRDFLFRALRTVLKLLLLLGYWQKASSTSPWLYCECHIFLYLTMVS